MSRVTVIIDKDRNSRLHEIQGKAIGKYDGNISFSDIVNFGLAHALENGFNVKHVIQYKKGGLR